MAMSPVITIFGMDADDVDEFRKHVPQDNIKVQEQSLENGMKGEPVSSMVILTLAGIALKGWISYLLFRGERSGYSHDVEIRDPDGRVRHERLSVKHGSAAEVNASVLRELSRIGISLPADISLPNKPAI